MNPESEILNLSPDNINKSPEIEKKPPDIEKIDILAALSSMDDFKNTIFDSFRIGENYGNLDEFVEIFSHNKNALKELLTNLINKNKNQKNIKEKNQKNTQNINNKKNEKNSESVENSIIENSQPKFSYANAEKENMQQIRFTKNKE